MLGLGNVAEGIMRGIDTARRYRTEDEERKVWEEEQRRRGIAWDQGQADRTRGIRERQEDRKFLTDVERPETVRGIERRKAIETRDDTEHAAEQTRLAAEETRRQKEFEWREQEAKARAKALEDALAKSGRHKELVASLIDHGAGEIMNALMGNRDMDEAITTLNLMYGDTFQSPVKSVTPTRDGDVVIEQEDGSTTVYPQSIAAMVAQELGGVWDGPRKADAAGMREQRREIVAEIARLEKNILDAQNAMHQAEKQSVMAQEQDSKTAGPYVVGAVADEAYYKKQIAAWQQQIEQLQGLLTNGQGRGINTLGASPVAGTRSEAIPTGQPEEGQSGKPVPGTEAYWDTMTPNDQAKTRKAYQSVPRKDWPGILAQISERYAR